MTDPRMITLKLAAGWARKVELEQIDLNVAWDLLLERVAPHLACPTCGQRPCPDPTFCQSCRTADAKIAAERRCAQCGANGGTLDPYPDNEKRRVIYLHSACKRFWEKHHR
jgi:hypothetical protein